MTGPTQPAPAYQNPLGNVEASENRLRGLAVILSVAGLICLYNMIRITFAHAYYMTSGLTGRISQTASQAAASCASGQVEQITAASRAACASANGQLAERVWFTAFFVLVVIGLAVVAYVYQNQKKLSPAPLRGYDGKPLCCRCGRAASEHRTFMSSGGTWYGRCPTPGSPDGQQGATAPPGSQPAQRSQQREPPQPPAPYWPQPRQGPQAKQPPPQPWQQRRLGDRLEERWRERQQVNR